MSGYRPREYRKDYLNIRTPAGAMSIYLTSSEWITTLKEWSVTSGHASQTTENSPRDGGFRNSVDWGFATEQGLIRMGLMNQGMCEMREKRRAEWPDAARDLCERYEIKLFEILELLDDVSPKLEQKEAKIRELQGVISNAERKVAAADAAAAEMRRRADSVDASQLRRELAAEFDQKTENISSENRRLAAELHEALSKVEKLAEDKRRLRAALNMARNGR